MYWFHMEGFQLIETPRLNRPLLIAGFTGWGNALDVSAGMVEYIAGKLSARPIAEIRPDLFFRYDENRPVVDIVDGRIRSTDPPGGVVSAAENNSAGRDVVILRANEPSLRWYQFTEELYELCAQIGVTTVITLGSMYDNVLHTDRLISGISAGREITAALSSENITPVRYKGPGAIHTLIQIEGEKRNIECASLWCHCPYYLEGPPHYGLLSTLGDLLAKVGGFALNTDELKLQWKELSTRIQALIDENPKLQSVIRDLRKAKVEDARSGMKAPVDTDNNVIHIRDFLDPK